MKTTPFWGLMCLGAMALSDDLYLQSMKIAYDYDNWPSHAEATTFVSTNWIPDMDFDVPDGSHIMTNSTWNSVRFTVFAGHAQSAEIRATQFGTPVEAKERMINFLSECSSTTLFARGTNEWNTIGDLCYVRDSTENPPICIFYHENVIGTVLIDDPQYISLDIARRLLMEIQSRPSPCPD